MEKNKKFLIALLVAIFIFTGIAGFFSGLGLESLTRTVNVLSKPGVGHIVYVHPELAEVQNPSMRFLEKREYVPWEPVVIIDDMGDGIVRVRFCSDGYESTYHMHWFATYRRTITPASYALCDNVPLTQSALSND